MLQAADRRARRAITVESAEPGAGRVAQGRADGSLVDARRHWVEAPPRVTFAAVRRIGGKRGWYAFDRLWRLRARIDGWLGGVGIGEGRRDPEWPRPGDRIDWWRVEAFDARGELRLRAETRLPGTARLDYVVEPCDRGSIVHQRMSFAPKGRLGRLYWFVLRPLHDVVFAAMLRGLAERATEEWRQARSGPLSGPARVRGLRPAPRRRSEPVGTGRGAARRVA